MLFRLAATTGLRRGELLGLRWSDVDLDTGRLEVTQALTAVGYTTSSRLTTRPVDAASAWILRQSST